MRKKGQGWESAHDHWLKALWSQEANTARGIARQMGFSLRTVGRAVERLGLQPRRAGRPKGETSDKERNEEIRRKAGAGVSEGTLMNTYGLSSRRIKQILNG